MENNKKWGIGNAKSETAFDTTKMRSGEELELIHGEFPHSRQDNTTYARTKDGKIFDFDGHRRPVKIEIEEYNYLKQSQISGNEIRKGCSVKVYCEGIQILDEPCRNYESGYRIANQYIISMEEHWSWFPKNVKYWEGKTIGYHDQLCKIKNFIVSQSCMIIETVDGKPFKKQLWEDDEDYEEETEIKIEILSPHITWYPRID